MRAKTSSILLVALLTAGCIISAQKLCAAADIDPEHIDRLVQIIATPKTPSERPPEINEADWKKKWDEAWVRLRGETRDELIDAGAKAVQPLLDLINRSKDNSVTMMALTILSSMKDPGDLQPAGPVMIRLLKDENPGIRYLAVKTIGVMKHRNAAPHLNKLAEDKEDVVRLAVADALGWVGDANSVKPLLALAQYGAEEKKEQEGEEEEEEEEKEGKKEKPDDNKKAVRLHALAALGRLGYALDVVPKFIDELRSEDVNEREVTVEAVNELLGHNLREDGRWLIALTPEKREPIIVEFEAWWKKTLKNQKFRVAGEPELMLRVNMMLQKWQKKSVRLKAIAIVGRSGNRKAVDYLILAMLDEDTDIRKAAAAAAEKLSDIRIKYLPTDTEAGWTDRVEEFRRRWEGRERP